MSNTQNNAQDQLIISGSILNITMFQQKLMRNFFIINNRLKKLQALGQIEKKTKNLQKQLKFLTNKVQSIIQKIPKQGNAISKKDVMTLMKDQIIQLLNSQQQKIKQTQTVQTIYQQIQKIQKQFKNSKTNLPNQINQINPLKQNNVKQTSFTAGTVLLSQTKKPAQASKQLLNEVLTKQQSKFMNKIINVQKQQLSQFDYMKKDIQKLYQMIENLQLGKGLQSYIQKQVKQFQNLQRPDTKSNQSPRKSKISQNKKGDDTQDNLNITKQDFLARKTFANKNPSTILSKQDIINGIQTKKDSLISKGSQLAKIQYIPENKLLSKAQRSNSLKKLDKIQRKLRVDDLKDLNSVLKQIQLRLQNKVPSQTFKIFTQQFQQKLEILRITKDPTNQLNDLRKIIYNLDNKVQYIITFLQSTTNQDDALIVKKKWTCISCDKMVQKFDGKIGGHLNWNTMQAKKISPTKIGGFGQTGQLASKIKSLLDNSGQ